MAFHVRRVPEAIFTWARSRQCKKSTTKSPSHRPMSWEAMFTWIAEASSDSRVRARHHGPTASLTQLTQVAVACKYPLPLCALSSHLLNRVFYKTYFFLLLISFSLSSFNALILMLSLKNIYLVLNLFFP